MSNLIHTVLDDIYSGKIERMSDVDFATLVVSDELDHYIEESVKIFLEKMREIPEDMEKIIKVSMSVNLVSLFGNSIVFFSKESVCYAVYLICVADKNDWMEHFLSGVMLRAGDLSLFLHHSEEF